MKKKINNKAFSLTLLILFFGFPLTAQKNSWSFGVNGGFKQEINPISQNYRHVILGKPGFSPQADFRFSYYFHDHFAIESGLSYSSTKLPALELTTLLHANLSWEESVSLRPPTTLFHAIQIPALLSSSFSIWKNLKFYAKTGLCLSFMMPETDMELKGELTGNTTHNGIAYQHALSYNTNTSLSSSYELLFNAGIGIGYEFPLGLGISLNASFAQGFLVTTEVLTSYGYRFTSEYDDFFAPGYENISLRTSYYSLTLGLFYKIKSNKK